MILRLCPLMSRSIPRQHSVLACAQRPRLPPLPRLGFPLNSRSPNESASLQRPGIVFRAHSLTSRSFSHTRSKTGSRSVQARASTWQQQNGPQAGQPRQRLQEGSLGEDQPRTPPIKEARTRSRDTPPASEWASGEGRELLPLPHHITVITSTSNPLVKFCLKLRQSASFRLQAGQVLVPGAVPLREICQPSSATTLELLFCLKDSPVSTKADLESMARRVVLVSEPVMSRLSGVEKVGPGYVAGVLALPASFIILPEGASMPQDGSDRGGTRQRSSMLGVLGTYLPPKPRRILALDGVQDPGNLGTLLRTALAFRWDAVLLLPGCCDPFNDKALRASRGAAFRIPIISGPFSSLDALAKLHDMTLYAGEPAPSELQALPVHTESGALEEASQERSAQSEAAEAEGLFTISSQEEGGEAGGNPSFGMPFFVGPDQVPTSAEQLMSRALCLILGSEGQGLSAEAQAVATPISIDMPGGMESLNVAVAGGIFMHLLCIRGH